MKLAVTVPRIFMFTKEAAFVEATGLTAAGGAAALGAGAKLTNKLPPLTGSVQSVNESMSVAARTYRANVTGMNSGTAFVQNGVRFDGYDAGSRLLIDAKYGMEFMVNKAGNGFKEWARVGEKFIQQAERQIAAAEGALIEWRFSSKKVADVTSALFKERKLNITVKHAPE